MTPMERNLLYFTGILCLIQAVNSLSCYNCVSSEPGCGQELNIRLQRTDGCRGTGTGGGENFCVKAIRREGGTEVITRGCLMTFRDDTRYRESLPTVQRHGYCSYGRNDDPFTPYDETLMYCFCNDWNGCNSADNMRGKWLLTGLLSAVVVLIVRKVV